VELAAPRIDRRFVGAGRLLHRQQELHQVGAAKNIMGTFTPPVRVSITTLVLQTLSEADRRSGIGEMLKVHAIAGPADFDRIAGDYASLLSDDAVLHRYIRRSLEIKRSVIEIDEFDQGPRNVMNYGHTFGHAIEAATGYAISHGIAVTIGMDMANYVAVKLGRAGESQFQRMHPALRANYAGFGSAAIPLQAFFAAIAKDKKHTDHELRLVLPDPDGRIGVCSYPADDRFRNACDAYFAEYRGD
jgi:3-dehydroquinate synthase